MASAQGIAVCVFALCMCGNLSPWNTLHILVCRFSQSGSLPVEQRRSLAYKCLRRPRYQDVVLSLLQLHLFDSCLSFWAFVLVHRWPVWSHLANLGILAHLAILAGQPFCIPALLWTVNSFGSVLVHTCVCACMQCPCGMSVHVHTCVCACMQCLCGMSVRVRACVWMCVCVASVDFFGRGGWC